MILVNHILLELGCVLLVGSLRSFHRDDLLLLGAHAYVDASLIGACFDVGA